jgi:hypothetical protein
MRPVYLYTTTAAINDGGATLPVRFSQGSGYNHPSAPGYFAPILTADEGVLFTRSIYQDQLDFGLGKIDAGVVTGVSLSGEYDWLEDAGFGREAILYLGDESSAFNTFTVVAKGRASSALVGTETLQIGWEDQTQLLANAVSPKTFLGTNNGPIGLEGTENDIKGKAYPRAFGKVLDIEPVLVNSSLRIYGWNYTYAGQRALTAQILDVRVRGSSWTFVADYPNAAALAASTPTVGFYNTCENESLILMGGSTAIDGDVRLDVVVGSTAQANYTGGIVKQLLLEAGVSLSEINVTELNMLDTVRPYYTGYYTNSDTVEQVVDDLLASVLAYGVIDPLGVYRFGFIPTVVGTPTVTLREFSQGVSASTSDINITTLEPVLDTASKNIPAKSVKVNYRRRWDVQDKANLATGLNDQTKLDLSTEYLTTTVLDNDVTDKFLNAKDVEYSTLLVDEVDAIEIRNALGEVTKVKPKIYRVTVAATPETIGLFRPGITVNCYYRRFGLSSGYQFFVTAVRVDTRQKFVEMTLRGIGSV